MRRVYDEIKGYLIKAHGVAEREIGAMTEKATYTEDVGEADSLASGIEGLLLVKRDIEMAMRGVPQLPPVSEEKEQGG